MDVPARLLRKNHRLVMPSQVLYFDTETAPEETEGGTVHRMKLCWSCKSEYDREGNERSSRWMEWKSTAAFCRYMAQNAFRRSVLWVFAHNVFFDLQASGFFEWFTVQGWELQFVYEAGLTYILVIRKDDRTIKCVSTTNYFQTSLAKIGDMVGLPKLDVSFETSTDKELSVYCRRDVEIVKAAMESYWGFVRRNDLGSFAMTIPSQAMKAFRHRFMDHQIWIHRNEKVQNLETESYYGGRTECFRLGKQQGGPFVTVDVNSMYPAVMASESVPTRLVDFLVQPDSRWLDDALRAHCVVSRCILETDQPIYAVRMNKRVCFPIGRFSTVLCTPGIVEARKRGHLVSLDETAVYEKAVLFRSFVHDLYRLRMEYKKRNEAVWVYLCKILLNALYGKWAEHRPVVEEETVSDLQSYRREEILDLVTGKMFLEYQLLNKRITIQGDEVGHNSMIAISSHITEAARIRLWRLIETAGPDRVLYCDTDSLKLRQQDIDPLRPYLHDTDLGKLKVEKVSDDLDIWGLKAYSESGVWKVKGIPRKAELIGPHTYSYEHFLRQATHMRRKQITGMLSERMVKRLNLKYQKGIVSNDGRVTPFQLSLDDPLLSPPLASSAAVPISPRVIV